MNPLVCTLALTTAHSKVGTLSCSKASDIYTAEEVHFSSVVAEQIALALRQCVGIFDASQASAAAAGEKERSGLDFSLN